VLYSQHFIFLLINEWAQCVSVTIRYAGMAWQGQTLQLIGPIRKLRRKQSKALWIWA